MSKILIDESLFKTIICALDYAESHDKRNSSVYRQASEYLVTEAVEQRRFSILQWHPASETPTGGRLSILVRVNNGIEEWAYLPE